MCKPSQADLLAELAEHLRLSEVAARRLVLQMRDSGLAHKVRTVRRLVAHSRHEITIVSLLVDQTAVPSPQADHYTCDACRRLIPVGMRCPCGAGHIGAGMARESHVAPAQPPAGAPSAERRPTRRPRWLWSLMGAAGLLGAMWSLALWIVEDGLPMAVPL